MIRAFRYVLFAVCVVILSHQAHARAEYYGLDQPDAGRAKGSEPCFSLLADGWELLRLRAKGATLADLGSQIQKLDAPEEVKGQLFRLAETVWPYAGDGWDGIGDRHRACMADFYAGKPTKGWYE